MRILQRAELLHAKSDLILAKQDFEQLVRLVPQYPGAQERLKFIKEQLQNPQK